MVLFYSENQSSGNSIRIYNDGRPVIGHRNLIKEIHFIDDQIIKQEEEKNEENNEDIE